MSTTNRFEPMNHMNEAKHIKNNTKKQSRSIQNTSTDSSTSANESNWNPNHIISKIKNNVKLNPMQTTHIDPLLIQVMKYKNNQSKNTETHSDTVSENSDDNASVLSNITTESEIQRREDQEFDDYIYDKYHIYYGDYQHFKYNYCYPDDEFQTRVLQYLDELDATYGTTDDHLYKINYNYDYE